MAVNRAVRRQWFIIFADLVWKLVMNLDFNILGSFFNRFGQNLFRDHGGRYRTGDRANRSHSQKASTRKLCVVLFLIFHDFPLV